MCSIEHHTTKADLVAVEEGVEGEQIVNMIDARTCTPFGKPFTLLLPLMQIYGDFMSIGGVESVDPEVAAVKGSKG